ncbi:hypothetical protein BASA81_008063 [Batrachochytrium salamandrivorans]|nr:hypothetical protein BASA81_008063 [Batrachochytrium salamandrivorans]
MGGSGQGVSQHGPEHPQRQERAVPGRILARSGAFQVSASPQHSLCAHPHPHRTFGSGPLNVFGEDFARAGNQWTKDLCNKDSDGDGRTNGQELQDPECKWVLGDPNPGFKLLVTHPGIPDECTTGPAPAPGPSSSKYAVIGQGSFGTAIRNALVASGVDAKDVVFGAREPLGTELGVREAVESASVVFLAVPANAIANVVEQARDSLASKVVIDCTNSFTWDKGPVWQPRAEGSVSQQLAALGVKRTVKAFNTFGAELFKVNSPAQVFFCGDDASAKVVVSKLVKQLGFTAPAVDLGPLRNAGVLENMALAWIHLATVGGKGREFALGLVQTEQ